MAAGTDRRIARRAAMTAQVELRVGDRVIVEESNRIVSIRVGGGKYYPQSCKQHYVVSFSGFTIPKRLIPYCYNVLCVRHELHKLPRRGK